MRKLPMEFGIHSRENQENQRLILIKKILLNGGRVSKKYVVIVDFLINE